MADLPPLPTRSGYSDGTPFEQEMKVEVVINDRAETFIFHNKPFKKPISWVEFDLDTNKLALVTSEGETRGFTMMIKKDMTKYLQNTFQILVVLTDDRGEPVEGEYFPLIIHRA